jgi:hypothetical protein
MKQLREQGARFLLLKPSLNRSYRPCNPGVVRTRDGYFVICRMVKYAPKPQRLHSPHSDHLITTKNVIMRLTRQLDVLDERPLVIDDAPLRRSAVRGLEDCRPFDVRGQRFLLCASGDRHPSGYIHQSLCRLDDDGRVASHRPLTGPFDDRHQKNWLPFARGAIVRAIYGYDPFTVLRLDLNSGRYRVDRTVRNRFGGANWRGSAGPLRLPGTTRLLILVHEVSERDVARQTRGLVYLHRFVECDSAFKVTRISDPFVFLHHGIEFACGMALAHDRRHLIIGLGIEDVSACLCIASLERVEGILSSGPGLAVSF